MGRLIPLLSLAAVAPFSSAASLENPTLWARSSGENSLHRRDNATTIPAAINVGPSQYWDGIDGPWSSFPFQIGGNPFPQSVRLFPATAAYATWVISGPPFLDPTTGMEEYACPDSYPVSCAQASGTYSRGGLYNYNESSTWRANSVWPTGVELNLEKESSGTVGYDTIGIGFPGAQANPVNVTQESVWAILDSQYWLGVFGLSPLPTNFTDLNDPQESVMSHLYRQGSIPGINYGYTAGNQYRLNEVFGSLVLGGYDANRFDPTKNISLVMAPDITRDLVVNIQSITASGGNATNLLPDGSIATFIDSTVPQIYLPATACTAFEDAFGLVWNDTANYYLVNDTQHAVLNSTNPNVTFTLGSSSSGGETVDITLPYGAFDLTVMYPYINIDGNLGTNTSYYFPLQRATNSTQYTLGRAFLQEAYIIVDYDRTNFTVAPCTWNQDKISNAQTISVLSPNNTLILEHAGDSSSGLSGGAIAGVVIGIVAMIAILGALLWWFRRRKTTEKKRLAAELEAKSAAAGIPKTSNDGSNNENKPFITSGELGGGEIHELTAPHTQAAQELDSPYRMDPNKAGYSEMEGEEYFGPGKNFAHEMPAGQQGEIFEMQGSDVHEMSAYERDVAKGRSPLWQAQGRARE